MTDTPAHQTIDLRDGGSRHGDSRAEAPTLLRLPVGIDATGERTETDPMGAIGVPADRYWGAET